MSSELFIQVDGRGKCCRIDERFHEKLLQMLPRKRQQYLELGACFNMEFTRCENLLLNAVIVGFSSDEMQARVQQLLDFSELGDFLDQPLTIYSSGIDAHLEFSIAIHVDHGILIMARPWLWAPPASCPSACATSSRSIEKAAPSCLWTSTSVRCKRVAI